MGLSGSNKSGGSFFNLNQTNKPKITKELRNQIINMVIPKKTVNPKKNNKILFIVNSRYKFSL
jgi:hypothetical protein